jgi:probable rRNA maturation factor
MIWNRQRKVQIAPRELERFLRRVEKELGVDGAGVTVCFVSDEEIAWMNWEFRGEKRPTDVLSFPAEERRSKYRVKGARVSSNTEATEKRTGGRDSAKKKGNKESRYLGDIAIAPGVARRYAKKNGRSLDSELRVLVLHGVLHLLGYDHETDRGEMDRLEQRLRRRFGLA